MIKVMIQNSINEDPYDRYKKPNYKSLLKKKLHELVSQI